MIFMIFRESKTVELKKIVVDDIKKEIVAFANGDGGTLYVGVADDGEIFGVENPDDVILQISNMIRDAIKPDVTMFIHYDVFEQNDAQIVAVSVQRGTNRPYYLARKGLRPEGVCVRQGTASVPATDAAIRQMIKDTDGDSYEEMRSLEQELTFDAAKKEFDLRGVDFGMPQMQTLKILNSDGIYTNMGLLLSDQCVHTIKVAVFQGADQRIFRARQEYRGSLFQQMNEVYDFLDKYNDTCATFEKLYRIDTRDYPEVAIREALLNLLVHRDYAFRASGLISIYADRMEFVSVGGLTQGLELNDILMGISVCRNPQLANVFYRLQFIEAYGTGIRKIMNAYEDMEQKPIIESSANAFKIILPNVNFYAALPQKATPDANESKMINIAEHNGFVTRHDAEKEFGISSSTASRLLRQMTEKGLLHQYGKGPSTKYGLPK